MNKFYNLSKNLGRWYKDTEKYKFSWKYIKDYYARQAPFFDDNKNFPWLESGLKKKTNYKIRYLPHLKLIQIAFQESQGKFDWFINFMFFGLRKIKPYKKMPVIYKTHGGFTTSYKSIQDELHKKIEEICKNNEVDSIEIFGWSYGGAMTQLCLEDLTYHYVEQREHPEWFKNNIPLITGMTIGAPRVFYTTGIASWKRIQTRLSRLIMIANVNDIVTRVPFDFLGSKHILPCYGIGDSFSIKKIFNPQKYHLMSEYTKQINLEEDD